ncbi:ribosomal-protein-alanine N-acetyltransferase RimI [Bifidobacterium dolichotidis]|uniref:Ribosomal-protein-alanine N-acetyltransferase RimI n=1 Tax=Bifidobacterium dolichotidis TaxID=2306976 RepID=A0A430FTA5_9BIFI|nr:ribosomal protein S18-alanine N-acetyltransferase [Bifidobacterium dolichotidis]RSX56099.1 ribosomal-protein-alanine N-acetyltransferase RimI [Bifidobacterium dolichotidis]
MIVSYDTVDRAWVEQQITLLEQQLFGAGSWTLGMVSQELSAPARTYLLDIEPAEDTADEDTVLHSTSGASEAGNSADAGLANQQLCGYAGFWYDGDDAEIMTIGVAKQFQQQGRGARLLQALIDAAREQGANRMLLEVRTDNEPALALYEHFGFERLGLRKRYYMPEGKDAYTMVLELKPRVVGFTATTSDHA